MTRTPSKSISLKTLILAFLVAMWSLPQQLASQPVLGARNTALGGGGTAYLTGFEASLWNPANLVIHDRPNQLHIGLGHSGFIYEPVLSSAVTTDQYFNFTDTYFPYQPHSAGIELSQRQAILDQNYPSDDLLSQHLTRADIILGGVLWQDTDKAFSIVARARFASRINVGRGWYSDEFINNGNNEVREFTLNQYKNHLYELSFGYAREFTFINGLFTNLNKLHVGIAPKLVLAGPGFNAEYNGRYIQSENNNNGFYISDFSYQSTGSYSEAMLRYRSGMDPQQIIGNTFSRKLQLNNTGYGVGFDFGLTYIIPLWDDLSTIATDIEKSVVSKSIRISLSVNDIGFVSYDKNPLQLGTDQDTVSTNQQAVSESMFIGADGQYIHFLNSATDLPNPMLQAQNPVQNNYKQLLPTSINGGILLEIPRLKLMGDLTLGLNNTAFTSTKLALHLGMEVRPLQQFPIRVGTRLAAGMYPRFGLGTGFETRHWDFNIGTQLLLRSRTLTSEITGGAFAGIQLHL